MQISKLEQLIELAQSRPKKTLSVAYAQDSHTLGAIERARALGFIDAILVGDAAKITSVCQNLNIDPANYEIVHEPDEMQSAVKAVDLVNEGRADFIMKGLVSSDKYMRAILDKEKGLLPPKAVLSHVSVVENELYPRLLLASDVAVLPAPDLNQKVAMANYLIKTAKSIGIETPKVAVVTATEMANPKMPACVDAAILAKMSDRGQIKGGIVDGPLALDVAISPEACEIKGIKGKVVGDADCLLFPDIEAANVFYKCMGQLAPAEIAACVVGTRVPAILTSRGDSEQAKLYSIALASLQV